MTDPAEGDPSATKQIQPFLESANRELLDMLVENGVTTVAMYQGGAGLIQATYPIAAIEVEAAVLFADLPGYSSLAADLNPVEAATFANWFLAWVEGEAGPHDFFGGIVDKFIGDELMLVFMRGQGSLDPLQAALRTAKSILRNDQFGFSPKIGVASGEIAVAAVGTDRTATVSAMGHTVNLAARCVPKETSGIRIAIEDDSLLKTVFNEDFWEISPLHREELKGIGEQQVVNIRHLRPARRRLRITREQMLEVVRRQVEDQRAQGRVRKV